MWKDDVRANIPDIVSGLKEARPGWANLEFLVSALLKDVSEPLAAIAEGSSTPTQDPKRAEVCAELDGLQAALSEEDVQRALTHANAALQLLEVDEG